MAIFALSYNMLYGQSGLLSLGHGVYSGLGGFYAAHVMNAAAAEGQGAWHLALAVPLTGGLAGMVAGVLLGSLTTRRAGVVYAMITLGITELVHAGAPALPSFFGGEGGISTNRVYGSPLFGVLNFASQIQVYYLIAAWLFVSALLMHGWTRTPQGRLANAVRDNAERAAFVGFHPPTVRLITTTISAFFAGIAGALSVINFESINAEMLGLPVSGNILFAVFLGGSGYFLGPVLGAALMTFCLMVLSGWTQAWMLYVGVFFIASVMFAPQGASGIGVRFFSELRGPGICRLRDPWAWGRLLGALCVFFGSILWIELTYRFLLEQGAAFRIFAWSLDSSRPYAWIAGSMAVAVGIALLRWSRGQSVSCKEAA